MNTNVVCLHRKNCPQLTDRSSLVAESTRQLKMAHGLHTAEAGRNPNIAGTQRFRHFRQVFRIPIVGA